MSQRVPSMWLPFYPEAIPLQELVSSEVFGLLCGLFEVWGPPNMCQGLETPDELDGVDWGPRVLFSPPFVYVVCFRYHYSRLWPKKVGIFNSCVGIGNGLCLQLIRSYKLSVLPNREACCLSWIETPEDLLLGSSR